MSSVPRGHKSDRRKVYRRALAAMIEAGALTERGGRVYDPAPGVSEFSELMGV